MTAFENLLQFAVLVLCCGLGLGLFRVETGLFRGWGVLSIGPPRHER